MFLLGEEVSGPKGADAINIFVAFLLGCTDYCITFNSNEMTVVMEALSTVLGTWSS